MAFSKSVGNSPSGQSDDSWSSSSSHVNLSRRTSFSAPARLGRREPPRLNPAGHILAPGIGAHRSHDEGIANPSPPTTLIDDEDDGSTTPRVRVRFGFPSYPVPSLSARGAQVPVLNTSTYINATGQCQPQFPGHHATSFALQQQQQRLGQLVPQLVDANNRGQGQFPSSVNDFNGGNTTAFALRVLRQQVRLGPQSVNTTNGRNTTFTMSHQDQSGGAQPMPSGMANVQARGIAAANNTNANEAALLRALEAQLPADQAPNSAQSNGFQPNPRANTFQPNPLANAFQPGAREFNGDGNGYVGAPPHDVQRMQTPVPLQEGPFTPDGFTPTTYRHTPYGSDHHSATESPSGPFGDAFAEDSRVAFNNQLSIQLSNQLNDHLSNQLRSDQFTSGLIQHGAVQGSLSHVIEPIESDVVAMRSVVPEHIRRTRSRQLNELTLGPNMRPPAHIALHRDNFPFVDGPSQAKPTHQRGVVKFKNIPYGTKRNEIVALIGRNSHMLNDRDEPVHIIMERTTNRTNDAYVEFMTYRAAVDCVAKIEGQKNSEGRPPRLGDRPVELQLSSQAALMGDLFTQAKGVSWVSIEPTIYQNDNEPYPWKCFKGFITAEEMIMIIKHVEVPQRSPFSKDCPERPFDCLISILKKFPWYMTQYITIHQREAVYNACIKLICHLQRCIRERRHESSLTPQLLKRLWQAAMTCDGFTVTMKDNVAFTVGLSDEICQRDYNMPRHGNQWTHTYSLVPKVDAPHDVVDWYIGVIREETLRKVYEQPPHIQEQLFKEAGNTCLYHGFLFKEINLPRGRAFDNMTLAELADREFTAVTNVIRDAMR